MMKYSSIHGDEPGRVELIWTIIWMFGYVSIFTILLGIVLIWASQVNFYERILVEGVKAKNLRIDWDSASRGRAGRSAYVDAYVSLELSYETLDGKKYTDYAVMSVSKYQMLVRTQGPNSPDSDEDFKLLYLADDPEKTLLYPYEDADYIEFYTGWVIVVFSVIFLILGPIAGRIVKTRYRNKK